MSFSQRVLDLIRIKKIPKTELARAVGIPYTTLDSMLKRDSDGARIETVFRIASHLGVSVEELVYGEKEARFTPPISEEERALIHRFRNLDERGRRTLLNLSKLELEAVSEPRPLSGRRIRRVPVYDAPAAAGAALPLLSDEFTLSDGIDIPENADFGIKISGDSMEPIIEDGSIVWVQKTETLADSQIGVFLLNGESLCKRLGHEAGVCKLISENAAYSPITVLDSDELKVVGKVLLR